MRQAEISANVSALRETPLTLICGQLGYEKNTKDNKKWRTPAGTISITDQKFYDFSAGVGGGGAIDFVMHAEDLDYKSAVELLSSTVGIEIAASEVSRRACRSVTKELQKPSMEAVKPSPAPQFTEQLKEWLTDVRKIPLSVVEPLLNEGRIYASKFRAGWQAIFVHNAHAFQRVNPVTKFKGWVANSDTSKPMFFSEPDLHKKTAVVEGHVTGLSLQAMRPELNVCVAGSTGTIKKIAELLVRQKHSVVIAVDNDSAGRKIAASMPEYEVMMPADDGDDWNDELVKNNGSIGSFGSGDMDM
ncbi:MAG: toprim domain-containing protein [Gallionellaceae bacterium]